MKKLLLSIFAIGSFFLMTSCGNTTTKTQDIWYTYDFTLASEEYNKFGYWNDVFENEVGDFGLEELVVFTHKGETTTTNDITYNSFLGFCPSIMNDTTDQRANDWTNYQFASVANPHGFGYIVGHWNVNETDQTKLEDRSCLINFFTTVQPVALTLTNTAHTYWSMVNGWGQNEPFTANDYLALDIYAVNQGVATLAKTVYLANAGNKINTWQTVDITSLGMVQQIFFTMRSSAQQQGVMSIPAYFALGALQVIYPEQVIY